MQLGGWWRLWIALGAVYGFAVVAVMATLWPDASKISHHPSFIFRMSEPAQAVLNRPPVKSMRELERALIAAGYAGAIDDAKKYARTIKERMEKPWTGDPLVLDMANGHTFDVAADTTEADLQLLRREYTRVLQTEATEARGRLAMNAALIWLLPTLALCVLGLLARWIIDGFRVDKHSIGKQREMVEPSTNNEVPQVRHSRWRLILHIWGGICLQAAVSASNLFKRQGGSTLQEASVNAHVAGGAAILSLVVGYLLSRQLGRILDRISLSPAKRKAIFIGLPFAYFALSFLLFATVSLISGSWR